MGRVRGPKDGKFLSAYFVGESLGRLKNHKETKALVLVSVVGNEYCADDYLQASIGCAVTQHKTATILIADEVYWNNLRTFEDETPENIRALKKKAISIGDEFIKNHLEGFLKLIDVKMDEFNKYHQHSSTDDKIKWINAEAKRKNISLEIVRWKDWVDSNHDDFSSKQAGFRQFYESSPVLKDTISQTAEEFAKRHQADDSKDLWCRRSREYLIEECPAVMWCAVNRGYQFIAYPGEEFSPFSATKDYFVGDKAQVADKDYALKVEPKNFGNWLDIYFRRSYGHLVKNIHPLGVEIARAKMLEIKEGMKFKDGEPPANGLVQELTSSIMGDESIEPQLRMSVLLSALGELNEALQEARVPVAPNSAIGK